jgi:hypothetical protein
MQYIKTRGKREDTYRRRENNKGYQNSMKQHRHTSEGRRLGSVSSINTDLVFKPRTKPRS